MDDSFNKAHVEDWVFQVPDTSDLIRPEDQGDLIPETPRLTLPVPSSHGEAPKPEVSASPQEHNEAPLPPLPSRPTCERLELPFSGDDHGGCNCIFASTSDDFASGCNGLAIAPNLPEYVPSYFTPEGIHNRSDVGRRRV